MKVDRTKCRHEDQVVKFSLRVTKIVFSLSLLFTIWNVSKWCE